MAEESRIHPRTKTYLDVTYFTDESTVELGRNYYFGTVLDVSKGGVGLLTECPHEPNDKLWLEGLGSGGPVRVEVRWVKHYYDKYSMGVKFTRQGGTAAANPQGRIPGKWSLD